MGEDVTDMATTTSQLQAKLLALTGGKVDIMLDANTFKNTTQILREMAGAWEDMNDIQRASALELMGGKRQANTLSALIQNFETVEEAIEASSKSAGSALKENERYLDSIQGRLDQFNNALQSMWNNVLDDDLIKFIVQAGTELLKFIDNLGVVKTLVIGIGTYLIQKNFKGDLWGGLFDVESVDQARERLKSLQGEIATLQEKKQTPIRKAKIQHKQKRAGEIGASIGEFDTLSQKSSELKDKLSDLQEQRKALTDDLANSQHYEDFLRSRLAAGYEDAAAGLDKIHAKNKNLRNQIQQVDLDIVSTEGAIVDNTEALKLAEIQAKKTGVAGLNSSNMIKTGFGKAKAAVMKFGKEILKSMAYTMAITAVFEAIGNIGEALAPIFDKIIETPEELQEKFDELNSELSSVESELSNLQSELKDTDERIEELMSQGSLTFVEQEELSKLKSVSAELKAQIGLQENLQKSMQQGVNAASVDATNAYLDTSFMSEQTRTEKQEKWGEQGEAIGQTVGTVGGAIFGAKVLGSIASIGGPLGTAIGIAAGSILGGLIGTFAGESLAGAAYDSEQTVGEAMDSMLETRAKLKKDQDTALAEEDAEAYNEATEALRTYDAQMAKHISQIQQNYNAMDWELADPETRREMMEYADWLDKYNISMGTDGAKSNAIARMFGSEASDELKSIKSDIEAAMNAAKIDGTDSNFDFQKVFNSEALSEFKKRLYDIGLTITDVEYYFLDLARAEKEAEDSYTTYDTVKQINALSSGVKSLKDTFGEITEEGYVSTETLVNLEETFGGLGESWENFVDTVATGTGSIKEATEAINELLEAYLLEKMSSGKMTAEEQLKTIMLLQQLGVKNAKEYVDAMQKASMIQAVATNIVNDDKKEVELKAKIDSGTATEEETKRYGDIVNKSQEDYIKEIEKLYEIDLTDEEERLLIEKAITAEKAEQTALEESKKQGEYDSAIYNQKVAQDKVDDLQSQIDYYLNNPDVWQRREVDGAYIGVAEHNKGATISAGVMVELIKPLQNQLDIAKGELDAIEIPAEVTDIQVENAEQTAKDAKNALNQAFDDLGLSVDVTLKDPSELVDDIQNVFDTLVDAQKEYSENGYLSVDTLQSLLQLEPKYLDLLVDEEGNLNLTKDALYSVARARIIDMGIQSQKNILEKATALASEGSADALREQITVMESANEVGADFVEVEMAKIRAILAEKVVAGDLSQEEADAFVEGTMNQIEAVQVATQSALDNLNNSLSSSGNTATQEANDAFQDAMDYWENRIGASESRFEQIQNEIDLLESQGKKAGATYYKEQIDQLQEFNSAGELVGGKLYLLQQQLAEAETALAKVNPGSEQWWTIANEINNIHNEIDNVTASIQDLKDAMADTHWYMFDEAHDRVSTLTSDLENIRDILSNEDLFDDEGNFTKEGLGTLATYVQELGVFEGALANARAEMELFGNAYDPNKTYVDVYGNDLSIDSEQDWYDAAKKAEEQYDEWNSKVIETRYNIKYLYEQQIDAVEEYTQTLVENYNEYIDVVKEALDSERDLYEFKKSTEKKSKNMAALERRIASLSGSTNASDVAERRKLQAELTDAKSDMDDHYYSHAKEQQSQALDNEMTAYETAMNAYVEGLRTKLEESTEALYLSYEEMSTETRLFVDGVTQSVVLNAGNVKDVYLDTGEVIDQSLVTPWVNAANEIGKFSSSTGALGLMNSWTQVRAGAPFYDFQTKVSGYLSTPWSDVIGENGPVQNFKTSVTNVMSEIVEDVKTNVSGISGVISGLQTEIDKIKDTTIRIVTKYETQGAPPYNPDPDGLTLKPYGKNATTLRMNLTNVKANKERIDGVDYIRAQDGLYYKVSSVVSVGRDRGSSIYGIPAGTTNYKYYAKGTTGTSHDQWAITDEPQFGDELVLVPGKDGNLSFMRKGTGVVPADMTQKLFELAQIPTSDLMNKNLTAIVPNVTKNDFKNEFNFESLVHVDTVDSDTLPKLEKMVDKKIDDFSKALNYSLKRFAR